MGASQSSATQSSGGTLRSVLLSCVTNACNVFNGNHLLTSPTKNPKVILVTGASSGLGKDFALALNAKGHKVYGAARRVDKMKDLVEQGCLVLAMDITNDEQVEACVKQILQENDGRLDVLIDNAGYGEYGPVETTPISAARRQFDVNLFGLAKLTQEVIPAMREQQSGLIINISSMCGKMYLPLGAWYVATKHAIEGWSDCLRWELQPFGINVAIIEPGVIQTEFADVTAGPMLERSKGTPYETLSKRSEVTMSPPSVITKCVVRAVEAKRPKTRYLEGSMAKPLVFLRTWGGDRFFDDFWRYVSS
ncbi:short-chain dehydrogenase/reductase SDR [Nitzschia inconspicua]|uniref:Short-chain dehydrogenase/reductase SDR n=1 Tax=Nitzschia inconspicua TaxID=303405 RepID=A0A9K3M1T4_9STRA|nr:short-chain dehydrogenase/reductase SDR [Nitzschia inconspicua]